MKLKTTLNIIRAANPCADGWAKLLKSLPSDIDHDAHISFAHILESNGLNDALWALPLVLPEQEKERDKEARLFACDCAKSVLHIFEVKYPNDNRPKKCIEVARRFANGNATKAELAAAWAAARAAASDAAWDAARDAAWDAAWAAVRAAASDAARAAARAAAWDVARAAARDVAKADETIKQTKKFRDRFCTQEASK